MKTKITYRLFLLILFQCGVHFCFGQRMITGKVVDAEGGEAINSVNILIEGTVNGTVTDFNGNYELTIPKEEIELTFSYIGYKSQTVTIDSLSDSKAKLDVSLELSHELTICYVGVPALPLITTATTSLLLDSEFAPKSQIADFLNIQHPYQLLQNRVPGLQISQPGGDPNGTYNIRLRGLNSLTQNTEPLIVIDGIPVTSIEQVDPEDIGTIEVLRDVASAAQYGMRGGSGVIKITSKNPSSGLPLRVRLHSFFLRIKS